MTRTKSEEEVLDLDPEIDMTLRTIRRESRHQEQHQKILEALVMANNNQPRPLKAYGAPSIQGFQPSVIRPTVEANNFKLKPA